MNARECVYVRVCYGTEVTLKAYQAPGTLFCNIYAPLKSSEHIITFQNRGTMWLNTQKCISQTYDFILMALLA